MLTKNINFKNFKLKKISNKIKKDLSVILSENNEILKSLSPNYKNSYNKKNISKFMKFSNIKVIGMGGSILGTQSIYDFLKHKIKKKLFFNNNLQSKINYTDTKKKVLI